MAPARAGIYAYDTALLQAEGIRQVAYVPAMGNQSAIRAADIQFYNTAITLALAFGVDTRQFVEALKELGAVAGGSVAGGRLFTLGTSILGGPDPLG